MARRPRSSTLETRTHRLKLAPRLKPYDFTTLAPGIALGYRRNKGAGTCVARVSDGKGSNWTKGFAVADDHEDADGGQVLDYWQAQDKARALARSSADNGRPHTVSEALDAYALDLKARGGLAANAERVRYHLPPTLAAKPVSLITSRELQHLRDGLVGKIKNSSINRLMKGLKAALTLAAKHDPRITNSNAWKVGLEALPDAHTARNVILGDDEVRALVAAAYAENDALGLLVETAAVTGARVSQLARLEVADLQGDRTDPRLMMPSSRKGKGIKRITRRPVPITAALAARLQRAAGERERTESPLLRVDGKPWQPAATDYRTSPINVITNVGLDPKTVTLYSLRHYSIVRALLAGVPTRVVAAQHDTSVPMLERTYSEHIIDHADTIARRGLIDIERVTVPNLVALPGRRS